MALGVLWRGPGWTVPKGAEIAATELGHGARPERSQSQTVPALLLLQIVVSTMVLRNLFRSSLEGVQRYWHRILGEGHNRNRHYWWSTERHNTGVDFYIASYKI